MDENKIKIILQYSNLSNRFDYIRISYLIFSPFVNVNILLSSITGFKSFTQNESMSPSNRMKWFAWLLGTIGWLIFRKMFVNNPSFQDFVIGSTEPYNSDFVNAFGLSVMSFVDIFKWFNVSHSKFMITDFPPLVGPTIAIEFLLAIVSIIWFIFSTWLSIFMNFSRFNAISMASFNSSFVVFKYFTLGNKSDINDKNKEISSSNNFGKLKSLKF